jgi:hypothetical protein
MNAFFRAVIPFVVNVLRGKPATLTIGDAVPTEGEAITDGIEDLGVDLLTRPPDGPDFDTLLAPLEAKQPT